MDVPVTLHDGYMQLWHVGLLVVALLVFVYCVQTIRIQERVLSKLKAR